MKYSFILFFLVIGVFISCQQDINSPKEDPLSFDNIEINLRGSFAPPDTLYDFSESSYTSATADSIITELDTAVYDLLDDYKNGHKAIYELSLDRDVILLDYVAIVDTSDSTAAYYHQRSSIPGGPYDPGTDVSEIPPIFWFLDFVVVTISSCPEGWTNLGNFRSSSGVGGAISAFLQDALDGNDCAEIRVQKNLLSATVCGRICP